MQESSGATSIKVSQETKQKLKDLKQRYGASSLDALLQALYVDEGGLGAAADAMNDDGDDDDEPVKRRRLHVREPLYSLELLSEREGMLQYLTGFARGDIDLLIERFREVTFVRLFSLSMGLRPSCCSRGVCLTFLAQVIEEGLSARRQSNEGFRKIELEERVLIFLTRLRRKEPFQELGYQYGCGKESAKRYFAEMVNLFHEHLVPRLVFPRPPEELLKMARPQVKDLFPDLLAILDATNWEQLMPENFLANRLSYSAFKHFNAFQVLLGNSPNHSASVSLKLIGTTSRFV